MWGPLKTQQEKVPKSKAIKSTNKDVLFGHSNQATIAAGGGKMSLVRFPRQGTVLVFVCREPIKQNLRGVRKAKCKVEL